MHLSPRAARGTISDRLSNDATPLSNNNVCIIYEGGSSIHLKIHHKFHILQFHSQKGIITIQQCSDENQKGTITVQNLWQQSPSGSQWNIVEQL